MIVLAAAFTYKKEIVNVRKSYTTVKIVFTNETWEVSIIINVLADLTPQMIECPKFNSLELM